MVRLKIFNFAVEKSMFIYYLEKIIIQMKKLLFLTIIVFTLLSCNKATVEITPLVEDTKVEIEDLESYFKFDRSLTVEVALNHIKPTNELKTINSKRISVLKTTIISSDNTLGTFKMLFEGKVNDIKFTKEAEFSGFAKAPTPMTPYEIGSRVYARWSVDAEEYIKNFNIDKLLIDKDASYYTVDYLKNFVQFYTSTTDGQPRKLTDDELAKLKIIDLSFNPNNYISFRTEYQSIKSTVESRIDFDKEKHYSLKITTNNDFISKRYMQGVFNKLGEFVQGILNYDRKRYAIILNSDSYDDNHSNSINLSLQVLNIKNGEHISDIHKEITGFKPLTDLKDELILVSSSELEDFMKSKSIATKDEQKRNEYLKAIIGSWITKLQFSIRRNQGLYKLEWDEQYTHLYGNGEVKDVYFARPNFTLLSSTIVDNILKVKIQITSLNGEPVSNLNYDIDIRNIK